MASYKLNTGSSPNKTASFINLYFSNFKALFAANLLMIPFDLLAVGLVFALYRALGGLSIFSLGAAVIILNPGMAGVSLICRYICSGKEFSAAAAFKKGVTENWAKFLIHGVIFYTAAALSYFSIMIYSNGVRSNQLFWAPFLITLLISTFAFFASFYPNVMTVSIDLPLKNIYRNSALFSFGELKTNLIVTFVLVGITAMMFTCAYAMNNIIAILIFFAVIMVFLLPSTIQLVITFNVYDRMVSMLDSSRRSLKDEEDGEEEKKPEPVKIDRKEAEEIKRTASETRDEYIFFNGRMIKRSEAEAYISESSLTDSEDE